MPSASNTTLSGQVIQTVGRRVRIRTPLGERVCFLSGQRAVIGDRVNWVEAKGNGGKLTQVLPRTTVLRRVDAVGREQLVAANLHGLVVVDTGLEPPLNPRLIDNYLTAAHLEQLEPLFVLNKADLGIPGPVAARMALWASLGIRTLAVSAHTGQGLDALRAILANHLEPWALVGRSGVGKTSIIQALLPGIAAGPIGPLSAYWGTGKHTTSQSSLFSLDSGGSLIDSPGIRSFTPGGLDPRAVSHHFPGFTQLQCQFRDCLHRPDEQGCQAEAQVSETLLRSYRTLLAEVLAVRARRRP